jgi:hypothetical protein
VHEYATDLHSVSCPSSVPMHSQSAAGFSFPSRSSSSTFSCSQIPTFESKDAVARVWPDGDHATARTVLRCSVWIVLAGLKVNAPASPPGPYEYILTVLSAEHDASKGCLGFHDRFHARSVCPKKEGWSTFASQKHQKEPSNSAIGTILYGLSISMPDIVCWW